MVELPSDGVARVATTQKKGAIIDGIQCYTTSFGEVEGLPEPQPGTILVVSLLVKQAAGNRFDLASPGQLIRDEEGRPIGCDGLNK